MPRRIARSSVHHTLLRTRGTSSDWLALGATSIGSGIWTMHFIAMLGFTVQEAPMSYDRPSPSPASAWRS